MYMNMTSGILGQWIGNGKKYMAFSIQTHTQNIGQDNNSHPKNVSSGTVYE
jgi:hypothetical protein